MKVVQINCVYGKGSTGKITQAIHTGLKERGIRSVVLYGRGKKADDVNAHKTCPDILAKVHNLITHVTGIMYGSCWLSTKYLIWKIKNERPDIVHLQCINGYFVNIYQLIEWLKMNNIPTILTLHAEFMFTANCSHAYDCEQWKSACTCCSDWKRATKSIFFNRTARSFQKMKSAFAGFRNLTVVSVSPWLRHRAEQSAILGDKEQTVILNGVDERVFFLKDKEILREKYGIESERVILHVTADFRTEKNHAKGGYYVLELARRMPECQFIIVGKHEKVKNLPLNVQLAGEVGEPERLGEFYNIADLCLLTSRRETFSMVCAESLCCGTPVAGFSAGGPESIAFPEYSEFCEYGDIEQLQKTVRHMLLQPFDRKMISEQAKKCYSNKKMLEYYIKEYEKRLCRYPD